MLEMARERNLIVMATGHRMFSACGMLYSAGLPWRCDLMDDVITLNYHISPDDFTRAGEASSDVKGKLKQMA